MTSADPATEAIQVTLETVKDNINAIQPGQHERPMEKEVDTIISPNQSLEDERNPAHSNHPEEFSMSRLSRASEERLRSMLQDKTAEIERLLEEQEELKKDLEGKEKHTIWLNEVLDERHEEVRKAEKQAQKEMEKAESMAKEADNWKKTLQTTQQEQQLEQLRLQKEIEEWKKRVKRKEESDQKLSKQLQDARDHIFRLQPRRSFITETEAQEAFEDLFNNIQRWVENRLEGILDELDDGKLTSRPCTADAANRLLSFTFQRARQDFGTARTDEYHVLAIIMQFLNDNLFSRYFYCSLDGASLKGAEDRTVATIQRIESAMAKADRDSSQCREWRFEALNALVSQPQFREAQANLDRSLTENLLELLSILVPRMHLQELRESIGRNIVRPAVGLAHRLHLSTSLFSLRWTPNNNDVETGPIDDSKQDFSHYICYNVLESGKVVKPTVEKDGQPPLRVTYLFDVCPGLYCQSIQSGVLTYPRVICKPKILVAASFGNQVLAPQGPTIFRWLNHAVQHPENGARSLQTGIKNVSQGVKIPQQVANSKQNSSEAPRKPKRKLISSKGAGWFGGSR